MPRALLCSSSAFFDTALNGPFSEGDSQTIELKDLDKKIYDCVVQWTYSGSFVMESVQAAVKLQIYIAFLKLADRLDLSGPIAGMIDTIASFESDKYYKVQGCKTYIAIAIGFACSGQCTFART